MIQIIIYTVLLVIFFMIGVLLFYKLYIQKIDPFCKNEAKRGLVYNFKEEENYNSNGRVVKRGMAIIKEKEGIKIVPQVKIADTGILI